MPKYRPSPEEESLYSGPVKPPMGAKGAPAGKPGATAQDAGTPPGAKPGEEMEPKTTDEEIGQEQNTAIVSDKILMGPNGQPPREGDKIMVQVVKVYGDGEVEIKYAPAKKPGAEESSAMMSDSNQELDAMDSKEMM